MAPVFVFAIEITIDSGGAVRLIDMSQLGVGVSLELENSIQLDYMREYLNDLA